MRALATLKFLRLSFATFCLSFAIAGSFAHANEGGEGGKEEKKEEKKEGEGAEKKSVPECVELQAKLQTLKGKVAAKEKSVEELIAEKDKEKSPVKASEIVKELKKEHKELREVAEEYERVRNDLRYRFPEKGLKEGRTYERIEVKSLEDMETAAGVDGQIRRTMSKVRRQFGEPEPKERAAGAARPKNKEELADPARSITEPAVLAK